MATEFKIITVTPETIFDAVKVPLKAWALIVYHHTAVPDGIMNGTKAETRTLFGQCIEHSHLTYRQFTNGLGYHFLVNRNGVIEVGRRWVEQLSGAHTLVERKLPGWNRNAANSTGLGISVVGNCSLLHATEAQIESVLSLTAVLLDRFGFGVDKLYGHDYFTEKDCPGKLFPLKDIKAAMLSRGDASFVAVLKQYGISVDLDDLQKPITRLEFYKQLAMALGSKS